MSAVIFAFPRNPRALNAHLRVVREAVDARAKSTNAPLDQRLRARAAAVDSVARGDSVSAAIQAGYAQLPSVRQVAYRQPSYPGDAA